MLRLYSNIINILHSFIRVIVISSRLSFFLPVSGFHVIELLPEAWLHVRSWPARREV